MSTPAKPRLPMAAKQKKYWIIGGIAALVLLYLIITYNGLINRDEDVKRDWGRLQTAYQRRLDLTPRLVTVVKAGTDYEKQTLEKLATARAQAAQVQMNPGIAEGDNYKKLEAIQGEMAATMNRVIAIIEDYPNLKGDTAFRRLQDQLKGTENRIRVARNDLNRSVAAYNKKARGFPSGLVAGIFGFSKKQGFTADAGTDTAPEVKFKN